MNTKKKFLSFALACLMIAITFSAAIPVFADEQEDLDKEKAEAGYVCRIGDTYYEYFSICHDAAIDDGVAYTATAVGQDSSETIVLIADITTKTRSSGSSGNQTKGGVIQASRNEINIDGNGHTYNCVDGFKGYNHDINVKNLKMNLIGGGCFGMVQPNNGSTPTVTFENCEFIVSSSASRNKDGYFSKFNPGESSIVIKGNAQKKSNVTIQKTDATLPLIYTANNTDTLNLTLEYVEFDVTAAPNMKVIDIGKGGNINISNSTLKSKDVSALAIGAPADTETTSTITVNNSTISSEATDVASFSGNKHTVRIFDDNNSILTAPTLVKGASVRTTEGSSGIRFTASLPTSLLTGGAAPGEYGMLFSKTENISGEFVETELNGSYIMEPALKEKTVNGVYTFALTDIDANSEAMNTKYSARAYAKYTKGDATVIVYSTYNANDNSRSLAYVANEAVEDLKAYNAETGYIFEINEGEYSPYDENQYAILQDFADKYVAE